MRLYISFGYWCLIVQSPLTTNRTNLNLEEVRSSQESCNINLVYKVCSNLERRLVGKLPMPLEHKSQVLWGPMKPDNIEPFGVTCSKIWIVRQTFQMYVYVYMGEEGKEFHQTNKNREVTIGLTEDKNTYSCF